jgi:hypothetical protein
MAYFPKMTSEFPRQSHEFRRVLWTGESSQLVEMTVPVKGSGPEGRGEIGNGMSRRRRKNTACKANETRLFRRGAPRRPGEQRSTCIRVSICSYSVLNSILFSLKANARPSLPAKSRSVRQETYALFLRALSTTVSDRCIPISSCLAYKVCSLQSSTSEMKS